ncbi:neutral protease 2-like protein mep20 [Aspergillus sclerotioniger CBS 115572]|uniref:Neutral protease 2 n=1 Tax=Aspergillus sclerotioniger CBS 115572 TaxID=1450535 RepID=A0A317WVH0_9EURO|nr:neutral protease 2-like protein mep20 [Aspergillus sclerotioniger CBS 115572]PWY88848.1 neutral protease 2-like protein mep20 [Aspergillus sclerotioniger CBS 115572]
MPGTSLDVILSQVSNTHIKAEVKNTGNEDLTIVHLNFFGDTAPIKKVSVFHNETELDFNGIRQRLVLENLTHDALTTIHAGESLIDEFDIASTLDITDSGPITIHTSGFVPITTDSEITSYLPYTSNTLTITIDAAKAATVPKALTIPPSLHRRTRLSDCDDNRAAIMRAALDNAMRMSVAAANEAWMGSAARLEEYFKSSSQETRSLVANRLAYIAAEASLNAERTTYYCTDKFRACGPRTLAYTFPQWNVVVNCPIYWSILQPVQKACHAQDQANTIIHEFSHAPGVYAPGTDDLGYGYQAAMRLTGNQALRNADTYTLFTNSVFAGC